MASCRVLGDSIGLTSPENEFTCKFTFCQVYYCPGNILCCQDFTDNRRGVPRQRDRSLLGASGAEARLLQEAFSSAQAEPFQSVQPPASNLGLDRSRIRSGCDPSGAKARLLQEAFCSASTPADAKAASAEDPRLPPQQTQGRRLPRTRAEEVAENSEKQIPRATEVRSG